MTEQRVFNVLILCTGNSARSILAEALLNKLGAGQYRAYSAGSTPVGAPNPYAIEHLQSVGIDTAFARSKSWKEFTVEGSTSIDIVITVCDSAANEVCPIFPGRALMAHWGLPDPAGIEDPMQSRLAFAKTFAALTRRIQAMLSLNLGQMEPRAISKALNDIGELVDDE